MDAARSADDSADSSASTGTEADTDPPSHGRVLRRATLTAALLLGGALVLALSASPADAQDSGDSGSGFSSSGFSSTDSGGYSSTTSDSGGYSSSGYGSSDSGLSSTDTSSGYGSSDSAFGSTDTSSYGTTSDGSFTSSFSDDGTYGGAEADASTYSGETTGYTGSETGTTGFEGSPEMGPAHAEAVNTDSATWSSTTDLGGFEGSPEMGPAHAEAVNTDAATWSGTSDLTGFEGSPEMGPSHAEAVNADSASWSGTSDLTGFEGSPEVGPVLAQDMQAWEALARVDAADVQQRMAALGIDPAKFDPEQMRYLDPADPRYAELFDAVRRLGNEIRNPPRGDMRISDPYATRLYEALRDEGTRALVGAVNQFAFDQAWQGAPPLGDVRTELLGPLVDGFAAATRSPVAPVDTFDGLRDLSSRWQQHQLGQLLSSDLAYDPAQLARFADAVIGYGRTHPGGVFPTYVATPSQAYDRYAFDPYANPANVMYSGPLMWDGDVTLQVPEALALRALSRNPEASWQFTGMRPENLATAMRPTEGFRGYYSYTVDEGNQLRGLMDRYGADTIRGALIDAVAAELSRYPTALDRYADVTRLMGGELTSDPMRQAYVDVLGTYFTDLDGRFVGSYLEDIGNAALDQRATDFLTDAERMAQDFNRVDLVDAWTEVGRSEAAARTLGAIMNAWTAMRAAGFLDDANLLPGEVATALRPNALVLDTIRQGFEAIGVPEASKQALAEDIKYYGSIIAAFAGPTANLFGGMGKALAATGAGTIGSLSWAGSTYGAARETRTTPPPVHGDDFSRALAETLRADMAATLAARRGENAPTGRQVQQTLDRAFPAVGDPFDTLLALSAIEGNLNRRPGTHWSSR